jgi:hypothetical protein
MSNPLNAGPISHFADTEIISPSAFSVRKDLLRLPVPLQLTERRIYVYLEVIVATTYVCEAKVVAYRAGRPVGEFPATIADFTGLTNINQSVASLFNAGGSPVGDSLVLRLAGAFVSANQSIVIQPLRLNAEIDELRFGLFSGAGPTGYRAYLACLSTRF